MSNSRERHPKGFTRVSAGVVSTDSYVLRSIANSIEVVFPSAADQLRGIARKLEEGGLNGGPRES